MNRKKLIKKMALPAAIVFMVSLAVAIIQTPYWNNKYKQHQQRLNEHITTVTDQNTQYLTATAEKIGVISRTPENVADNRLIKVIQSELLLEHQKVDQAKRYLWMSDNRGEFIFGAPSYAFVQVNNAYDKNAETIIKEGLYSDRNDFLLDVIDQHNQVDFANVDIGKIKQLHQDGRESSWYYTRDRGLILSAPVANEDGQVQGTLFIKIDDSANHEMYYSNNRARGEDAFLDYQPLFIFFTVISGFFLWFLLPTWVYIDAQQRDVNNPGLWAFITLISLIFGLAIYMITRPSTMRSHQCPQCENELNGTGTFCPHCGFDLSNTYCPQCQYPIKPDWTFCPSCRAGLEEKEELQPVVEPEPSPEPAKEK